MEYKFTGGTVPVSVVAKVYGKEESWVRAGIISGWLPIGVATRKGEKVTDIKQAKSSLGRINYYISPKLLYEHTGYLWHAEPISSEEEAEYTEED